MITRYSRPEMRAIWTDENKLKIWLQIELLASEALVKEGVVPAKDFKKIKAGCDKWFADLPGLVARQRELEKTLNHDVIGFTTAVAEAISITYAEAEGIKVGMANEVEAVLESVLTPLATELRASLDFYEHQQDQRVAQVFLTGGSARSEFIVQALQTGLMTETKTWNPTAFLKMELPPQQSAEIEHLSAQMAVAVGTAVAAL